jgi:hypothetical protein
MIFIQLTHPLGAVEIMPLDVYLAMPVVALRGTRARMVTRTELIARAARRVHARV